MFHPPNSERYETDDFHEAAYCLYKGLELIGKIKKNNKWYLQFRGHNIRNMKTNFMNSEAKKIFQSLNGIRDYALETENKKLEGIR